VVEPILISAGAGRIRVLRFHRFDGRLTVLRYERHWKRVCHGCGCTDRYACIGGCHWARPGLCSRCSVLEGGDDAP
jgi:hypothetical protein